MTSRNGTFRDAEVAASQAGRYGKMLREMRGSKRSGMRALCSVISLLLLTVPCAASCNLDNAIGYTLVAKKRVVGFVENDKRENSFSGCRYGRILLFEDHTGVRCTGYTYHYATRPTAYIFDNSYYIKLCIDGFWFEAAALH